MNRGAAASKNRAQPGPRRAGAPQTRESILAAAAGLMAERGFHGMSMRDLAAAVGCALSSLYNHFPSKEALLRELQTRAFETLICQAEAALAGVDPGSAQLYVFIYHHVRYVTEHVDVMRVLVSEAGALDAPGRRAVRELKERYFAIGHDIVRSVLQLGCGRTPLQGRSVDAVEAERVTYNLFGMVNWFWGWYEPRRHGSVEQAARSIHDLMLCGVVAACPHQQVQDDLGAHVAALATPSLLAS